MKLLNKLMIAVFLASISSNLVAMKRDREKDQGPFPDHKRVRIEGSLLRDISDGLELALKNREQDKINELLSNDHVCIDCVMACRVYEFGLDTGNGLITEKMRPFLQWAPLLVFEMNHSRQLAFEMIIQRLHMDDVKVLTLEFDANFNNPNENIERIKSLASIIPSLRQLESFATDMKMTNDSCVQICTGLTRNSRLKHLRLENLSSEQISFLNKIIAGNNNLAELEIRNCTIGTHNIVTFGEAIKKNRTLQELTMDFCDISDEAMDTLAPFLEESSLRVISILEDEFGDVGWNALLDMLKKNNRLYEVNAELSNYSDEIGKKLIEKLNWMLEANRVLYNCSLVDELFDYVDDSNKYKEIQMQLSRNKWHTVRELYIGFRCADSNLFCFPIELIHYIASLTCKKEVFVPMYTRAIAGI